MNNPVLSIQEICEQFVTPAIEKSGWDRELQISYCEDANFVHTQLNTEYVLYYKPNVPVAVISVTESDKVIRQRNTVFLSHWQESVTFAKNFQKNMTEYRGILIAIQKEFFNKNNYKQPVFYQSCSTPTIL
jgi:type I site-specific restriction endonuclease